MDIKPYIKNINSYLVCDGVIDFRNENITQLADTLYQKAENELDFIKTAYEFVRDHISHSADINEDELTHIASDVLKKGVNAQFSIETEHLAFPVRPEMGETENFIVYPDPDIYVLNTLRENRTRTELWNNLPTKLRYEESSDRI